MYNLDNIDKIPDNELFLETLMMEIRGKSISYATHKKKLKDKEEKELIKSIQKLEDNLVEENIPEVEKLKQDLCNIREEKMEGFWFASEQILLKMEKSLHNISAV